MIKAAGILFISDGKALLLKRSADSTHGKEWAVAGGHVEEGETPEQAARREFQEECGYTYTGDLLPIMHTNDGQVEYDTFLAVVPEQFQPKLNDEHTAYLWCALDDYPNKTMPQVKALFDSDKVRDAVISTEAIRADSDFKESDHPRGEDGKFGSGGGGTAHIEKLSAKLSELSAPILAGLGKFKVNAIENRKNVQNALNNAGIKFTTEFDNGLYPMGVKRETGEIIINANNAAWERLQEKLDKKFESGEFSSKAKGGMIVHELAHQMMGDLGNKELSEKEKEIASKVSKYATKNNDEFVAEFLAGTLGGAQYPDDVKQLFVDITESVKKDSISYADSAVVTETDIAKQIRDKSLTSPQKFANVWLFALRISGTGLAYRAKHNEYVNRLPENYLSEEFLARCNGLPVIWVHPENDKLDSESFAERVVGTICLPYIEGDEVWGIAKIWDETAARNMSEVQLSTSPGVVFQAGTNEKVQLSDGSHVLIEGKPSLLDHLAIVENGVWDKGGEPSGVLTEVAHVETTEASRADSADQPDSSLKGDAKMADETVVTPAPENEVLAILKSLAPKIEDLVTRVAALEAAEVKEVEVAEAKGDEGNLPAPVQVPVAAKQDAEVVDKPAFVADLGDVKARLDAAEKEVATLRANAARADNAEEAAEFAKAQKKADDADQAYGDSAPRPLQGESLIAYRQRLLARHLPRSERWKDAAISGISDSATLSKIEEQVYADSMAAAAQCVGVADGVLIPFTRDVGTGRKITEFRGRDSFVKQMAPPKIFSKVHRDVLN